MSVFAAIVDWEPLLEAAAASFAFGLGILITAALGVSAALRSEDDGRAGDGGAAIAYRVAAVVCVGLIFAAVTYGIWLIGPGSQS